MFKPEEKKASAKSGAAAKGGAGTWTEVKDGEVVLALQHCGGKDISVKAGKDGAGFLKA